MTKSINSVNGEAMSKFDRTSVAKRDRHQFVGGSDARIIMGKDEKALHRLWRKSEAKWSPLTSLAS
jgi:predicted phage-related endonuclease